jgi:hypothetical protein
MRTHVALPLALLGSVALLAAQQAGTPGDLKTQAYQGKVVPLAGVLEKFGSKLDKDAAPHWFALVADDGKVYPLIKDAGARLFFKDERLLNRPVRLTGRLFPNTNLLQVVLVHSVHKGALHEVYYWCEVCAIRRNEKDICECCGGPMELREPPVGK